MSLVPNFDEEIFISYAHIDNQPLAEGLEGWVETLHERLQIRLEQLLGERVNIWRDRKLQGNDIFAETLLTRINRVALLVSILSPRYVKSEWCLRELNEFCRGAESSGGLRVGDKSRVFKVVKTYIPLAEHPPQLQGSLGYEFFEYDQVRGRAKEFSPEVEPARDIRYWEKLDDLAYDIKQLIETMRRMNPATASPANVAASDRPSTAASSVTLASGPASKLSSEAALTIYLAETTSDLHEERDRIKRELQQHGHALLPDQELPLFGPDLQNCVKEYLQRSQLSVHMIGSHYGIIPEEETRSIVQIQSDLAAERNDDFQRIIWMPVGLQTTNPAQQKFIDQFRLSLNGHKSTELLQTKLEDLKTIIADKINKRQQAKPGRGLAASVGSESLTLYLICDQQDMDEVKPLEDYLYDQGMDVILPAIEGDEAQILQDHKENLLACDAVMIYYGRANEIWMRMKQRELQKLAGYERERPLLAKAIYVGGPPTEAKERLRDRDTLVIKSFAGFNPASVVPFLEQLRHGQGA
ncbi:MAG TPA: TIR domain-containing protein [Pyrinomonadaceae bacterium]|nr:TIR domain-containing protein [Pyrinomonadaceae bacterium]